MRSTSASLSAPRVRLTRRSSLLGSFSRMARLRSWTVPGQASVNGQTPPRCRLSSAWRSVVLDIMSNYERPVHTNPPAARAARGVLVAAAAETVVTLLHFVHGARTYDDPGRLHVVGPALAFLAVA